MGKLQERLDALLKTIRTLGGETDEEQEQEVQDEEQEQLPEDSDTEAEEEATTESDDGEGVLLEQVTLALEAVHSQLAEVVQAVRLLDKAVKEQDVVIRGLATGETARLKDAMENGQWYKSLWVASRDAEPMTDKEQADLPGIKQTPMTESGGLLGPVLGNK